MSSVRRAKIRAPRRVASVEVDFATSWALLSGAIDEIHHHNASKLSFEELYRTAYTLVIRKHGKELYDAVIAKVRSHLETQSAQQLGQLLGPGHEHELFQALRDLWDDHCLSMRMISDILMYLDRVYSKETRVPLVYDAGLILFRDWVIRAQSASDETKDPTGVPKSIGERVYEIMTSEIWRERQGEVINRMAIKSLVLMLDSLPESRLDGDSLYVVEFEPRLTQSTREFYTQAASRLLGEYHDASVYVKQVFSWLDEEANRARLYLSDETTLPKLISTLEDVAIIERMKTVLELPGNGLFEWIDNDRLEDIGLAFKLILRVSDTDEEAAYRSNNSDELRALLGEKILKSGQEINQTVVRQLEAAKTAKAEGSKEKLSNVTVAVQWVDQVLALKTKYDAILKTGFQDNKDMQTTIENTIAKFVNQNPNCAQYLSLYIDEHMKKSSKTKDDDMETILSGALALFRFVSDKDLFETYYKLHLSRRLLQGRSATHDSEQNMITKLRMEVGTSFTSKLEGMFRDVKLSEDMMIEYKTLRKQQAYEQVQGGDTEIAVQVLATTFWPNQISTVSMKTVLPPVVAEARKRFEDFYLAKHSGRKLDWNTNIGTADVRVRFRKRAHEINMPTNSMILLVLFEDLGEDESLTPLEMEQMTHMPKADLIRSLQAISLPPKTRLLRKEPLAKEVLDTDRFFFNTKFESNMARIKVAPISVSSKTGDDSERRQTLEKVDQSRKHEADAAIVRVMKTRKTMDHANLVAEVTRQLLHRFKPEPLLIKQRIDALLERDYIERQPDNRTIYNYLA